MMQDSLRLRLLRWLLIPLLLVVFVGAVIAYAIARHAAGNALDKALLDPLTLFAANVRAAEGRVDLALSRESIALLLADSSDRMFYQIASAKGNVVLGEPDLPTHIPGNAGEPLFFDASFHGQGVRVGSLRVRRNGQDVTITIAETLAKRNELQQQILLGGLLPELLVALAVIGLVFVGITRALRPLDELRAEIASAAPPALQPVDETHRPKEVLPLIETINGLLARVRTLLDSQQRFIANAAHQLRTPIAGLQTQLELALRGESEAERHRTLELMHGVTVRAGRLANQLLSLAQIESRSQFAFTPQALALKDLLEEMAPEWDARAEKRGLNLGFDLCATKLLGDALLLKELASNLVDNAIQYTPADGNITVRCFAAGQYNVLQVEDDGIGIPLNQRDAVLERFYRVSRTPGTGSGLGLAIVAEITQLHGAKLEITAPTSGRGTLVNVKFLAMNEASGAHAAQS